MSLSVAVDHVQGGFHLEAAFEADAGITALYGRSGCGKTTLVNVVAGLVRPRLGRVAIDGTVLLDTGTGVFVPSHKRRIGYVFQEGRLFPHLDVRQNLLFGRWFFRAEGGPALDEVADLLGIAPLLARRPATLSGGEKQRVAIGRALLACPRLLLMDEPLASLDEARRQEILPYIERLRDEARLPIVYVSHALAEVARLATTVVALEAGRVVASGPAAEVLGRPDIAGLDPQGEGGAIVEARVARHEEGWGLTVLAIAGGELFVPRLALAAGSATRLHIRARDVMLSLSPPTGISALNVLAGRVAAIEPAGLCAHVSIDCGGTLLAALITRKSLEALRLQPGTPCHAVIKGVAFARGAATK